MTHWVPIYGSGPHRYLRPGPWDPTKVADPTHGAGTLRPTTRPAGSVCSLSGEQQQKAAEYVRCYFSTQGDSSWPSQGPVTLSLFLVSKHSPFWLP
jgi:hypothetical protein